MVPIILSEQCYCRTFIQHADYVQDPYFPHGVADLRYAITCEPSGERDIRIRTNQKTIKLSADSVPSRDEWVKAIRKVMFKAQNSGDSVKVSILPLYHYCSS